MADSLVKLDKFADAVQNYKKALKINPNKIEAHINMGTSQVMLGQQSQAVESFRKATKINPKMSIAHTNLGLGLMNLKRYE